MKMGISEKVKGAACVSLPVLATASYALTSFAAEGDPSLADTAVTALTTSVSEMATSIAGAIGAVIPIAIPLVGAGLVVTIGLKVFKTIANKA